MSTTFWKFTRFLLATLPARLTLAIALMVGVGLTEGLGLVLLVPILRQIGLTVQGGTVARIGTGIAALFTTVGVQSTLLAFLVLYALVMLGLALLSRWQTVMTYSIQNDVATQLRERLYRRIVNAKWTFFAQSRSSNFSHALTAEIWRVGMATQNLLQLAVNLVVTIIYLFVAFQLSASLTGIMLLFGLALLLLLRGRIRVSRMAGEGLSQAMSALYAAMTEYLGGLKIAKSYNAEDRASELFSKEARNVARLLMRAVGGQAAVKFWVDFGSVLILSGALYVSVRVLAIPTGGLLLLLFVFARTLPRLSALLQSYQQTLNALPAFKTVIDLEAECQAQAEPVFDRSSDVRLTQAIRLEDVWLAYDQNARPALAELDLAVLVGQTTAIVGPSGAGKTSVADLVIGLIAPTRGRVLLDEVALTPDLMWGWRNQIAYVQQETFLFHDTIKTNLLWAAPDASEAAIWISLQLAAADDFVRRLPLGLQTVVGDRGIRLSGGERQRLALARALLRKPSLLILDEATSDLDVENEGRIRRAIDALHGELTILLITHRLSTVQGADIIHVLEQGRLIESGTWNALMAREDGRFHRLWRAQTLDTPNNGSAPVDEAAGLATPPIGLMPALSDPSAFEEET
jgi:ATP-binding cassette subfamily C protein